MGRRVRILHEGGPAWGRLEGEEVVLELDAEHEIGSVVLEMGAFSFGHPKLLDIDVSTDGQSWRRVWAGETSVLTVRAAVADPVLWRCQSL